MTAGESGEAGQPAASARSPSSVSPSPSSMVSSAGCRVNGPCICKESCLLTPSSELFAEAAGGSGEPKSVETTCFLRHSVDGDGLEL